MKLDHIAINAIHLETELQFLIEVLNLSLLQKWDDLRQAYVGFNNGPVIGVIENKNYCAPSHTMAHLAFSVAKEDFLFWVEKIQTNNIEILAGPKPQRGGETILFMTPSKNIIEICYPHVQDTIARQTY